MNDDPDRGPVDAGTVKYLRLLVTILSVTMVVGFIIIVVLFVIRFSDAFGPARPAGMALPDSISLPAGARATAFTRGEDWFAVVTDDDRILIFDAASGALRKEISVR